VSRSHQELVYTSEKVGIRNSPARCRLRSETIDYVIRCRVAREMSRLSPTRPRDVGSVSAP
jgi:hypothetical protein